MASSRSLPPSLVLLLLALSTTQACRCSQDPEPLSRQEVCDEVGFALSSRAVACGATGEQGNAIFEQFSAEFSCEAAPEDARLLDCVAEILQGPCENAPTPGSSLELALAASTACAETVQFKDGRRPLPPCQDASSTRCGEQCVFTQNDAQHCGACGNKCPFDPKLIQIGVCEEGSCAVRCRPQFGDCDGDPSNGCETDFSLQIGDPLHCGQCGQACAPPQVPGQQATCISGVCAYPCDPMHLDCDGDPTNGCETEIGADNCFFCGENCFFQGTVIAQCNFEKQGCETLDVCEPGTYHCGDQPVCETQLSVDNCGGCGVTCPTYPNAAAPVCEPPGYCPLECLPGFLDCNKALEDGCEVTGDACP